MSKLTDSLASVAGVAEHTCWQQWQALAARVVEPEDERHPIVDPEALVLTSLGLRSREKRLDDMLLWLAKESHLLSLQRIKSMARMYPAHLRQDLSWFAATACESGDPRWRSLVSTTAEARGRPGKSMPQLSLSADEALMLRMRSGLGVGIKADLVACLAGMRRVSNQHAGGCSVADLADVLGYSKNATRQALDEMTRADFVRRLEGRPARFLLGHTLSDALPSPVWGYSAQVFAILLACEDLLADPAIAKLPEVVQASRLRELHDRFRPYWSWFGVGPVDTGVYRGELFFSGFQIVIEAVAQPWELKYEFPRPSHEDG